MPTRKPRKLVLRSPAAKVSEILDVHITEWKAYGRVKIPYHIHPRSGSFVAFAGLYDAWSNPKGEELQTCTIVTRDADDAMAHLHNRMPVGLAREDE
jgi:putative SOS response-associated peptidase YedK